MIKIQDILELEKFKSFRLVAGAEGLERTVVRGGFIDYESAENLKNDDIKNEIILSNLPMINGHPEKIVDYIQALIESETACFALKTTLFKDIPQEAIALANRYNYPIFLFDDIFLDKLILEIDKLVNEDFKLAKLVGLINKIQSGKLTRDEIRTYAGEMNKYFYEKLLVYSIKPTKSNYTRFDIEIAKRLLGERALVIPVEDVYLILFSSELKDIDKNVIVQKLGLQAKHYHIGVSSYTNDYGILDKLISESKTALKYACYQNVFLSSYNDLGIYQMLIPILEQAVSTDFYKDIIEKIMEYDKVHSSDLLKTTIAYIHSDGDIKETSEKLFQHNNTIRFRIRKIKQIIQFDSFIGMKYETLALAVHLWELDENKKEYDGL